MSNDLDVSGPTVTLFGDLDTLGDALGDELSRRGFSTHAVTTPMGWIKSVTHAVVRMGTPVGERAFGELAEDGTPATHVVAVCELTDDPEAGARLDQQCRRAGQQHVVTLLWHPALELRLGDDTPQLAPRDLAADIADEVRAQAGRLGPSFSSRTVDARP